MVPALRAVGNVASGDDEHTQALMDAGVMPRLVELSRRPSGRIAREVCWIVSNVAAGTLEQRRAVFESGAAVSAIRLMATGELAIKKEAVWVIANAVR